MKPGDLAFVTRGRSIEGKIALILEILQSKGGLRLEEHCRCLIEGKLKMIPLSWVEVISE
jgi:hypothetical protein